MLLAFNVNRQQENLHTQAVWVVGRVQRTCSRRLGDQFRLEKHEVPHLQEARTVMATASVSFQMCGVDKY